MIPLQKVTQLSQAKEVNDVGIRTGITAASQYDLFPENLHRYRVLSGKSKLHFLETEIRDRKSLHRRAQTEMRTIERLSAH
jgi:hypothetical protein